MKPLFRMAGAICDKCLLCKYARMHPGSIVGRIMEWHGRWCPAWKAQKEMAKEAEKEGREE